MDAAIKTAIINEGAFVFLLLMEVACFACRAKLF
jgi:hypothetical protein